MAPAPTIRRLLREAAELSPSPPAPHKPNPAFCASPVSDSDLHEWHFTLLGPPSPSPYSGGLYHGRISLPPAYPMRPPNFRFLTPSGRFEVNREICLSISGFHEETWQPAWGIRSALVALRAFMAEQGTAGQVGGLEASDEVRKRIARESRKWRCGVCGDEEQKEEKGVGEGNRKGITNEERMKWWWEQCREMGVNVGADGEDGAGLAIEALPEGLSVQATEAKTDKGKEKKDHDEELLRSASTREMQNTHPAYVDVSNAQTSRSFPQQVLSRNSGPAPQPPPVHNRQRNPSMLPLPPEIPAPPPTQARLNVQRDPNTITFDRVIAGVFIALVLMIFKRLFYPSASIFGIDSIDELHMVRE